MLQTDFRKHQSELSSDGWTILPGVLSDAQLDSARQACEGIIAQGGESVLTSRSIAYGIRNLIVHWPEVATLCRDESVRQLIAGTIGQDAAIVRGLFFDKPPERTWTLPWHRDRTIAVQDFDTGKLPTGYTNPTRKAGVLHLNAPNELLDQMLTLRFSLDAMNSENGQLVVLCGSHRTNGIHDDDLGESPPGNATQAISCGAGDVFVMRPLLAHCSVNSASLTQRRRVVHLELCSPALLDSALKWNHLVHVT